MKYRIIEHKNLFKVQRKFFGIWLTVDEFIFIENARNYIKTSIPKIVS